MVIIRTPAASARRASSGALRKLSFQPSRVFSVTGTLTAPATASISVSAWSRSFISAEPLAPPPLAEVTFLAGQPMLMSISRAPRASTCRAASAIQRASRPASCTAVLSSPAPSSAFSRTPGFACTISWLATISLTTSPAPNRATSWRNGRSVIPAMGARKTGGDRALIVGCGVKCSILVQHVPSRGGEADGQQLNTEFPPKGKRVPVFWAKPRRGRSGAGRPPPDRPDTDALKTRYSHVATAARAALSGRMKIAAIIVAAGRGRRAGGALPKQWQPLAGRRVIDWTIAAFAASPEIDHIVAVLHPDDMARLSPGPALSLVPGGTTRSASARNGLEFL